AKAIENYKKAGDLAGRAREYGASLVKPGVKLISVAEQVEQFISDHGGTPAFPCCLSIDADAAHDTPGVLDERVFAEGQVVKLDTGAQVDGWIGDTAITVEVGTTRFAPMMRAVQEALAAGLAQVRPNVPIRDISAAVEAVLRSHDLKPVSNLTGHSVDQYQQHAGLSIPNVASMAHGNVPPGTAIAIEPFGTDGGGKIKNSTGGHIYHLMGPRPQRDPMARQALEYIVKHHNQLPFAERWIANAVPENKVAYAMRLLERTGAVKQYSILKEVQNGQVAQFEHTVLVLENETIVTTRV
ncbi:MAG: type II methionyl aminopeptidase, partial [Candidatus Thermoplasmatota archaeon]